MTSSAARPARALSDAEELDALASRLRRCTPSRIDPERFHVERDAICCAMLAMSKRLATETVVKPDLRIWRPKENR